LCLGDSQAANSRDLNQKGGILLGVSGGSFGEGIDLPGNLLKGVIVAGLPLARPDLETDELLFVIEVEVDVETDFGVLALAVPAATATR
jgi:hypothetical protein